MIPRWVIEKREAICSECERATRCNARVEVYIEAPRCPLAKLASAAEEVAARAWPDNAARVYGCCDFPVNYL